MDLGKKGRRLELCVLRWRFRLGLRIGRIRPGLRLPLGAAGSWVKALSLEIAPLLGPGSGWVEQADPPGWVWNLRRSWEGSLQAWAGAKGRMGCWAGAPIQVTWSIELSGAGDGERQAPSARRLCTHMPVSHVQFSLNLFFTTHTPCFLPGL